MVDAVGNIRLFEDALAFLLLTIGLIYLIIAAYKTRNMPIQYISISLIIGFLPLYVWKGFGAFRRIFVDKVISADFYTLLDHTGEMFESLSGLILALCMIYILLRLKGVFNKK